MTTPTSDETATGTAVIASTGLPLLPDAYERDAKRNRTRGLIALNQGRNKEADRFLRAAIEDFVNAFLFDRRGHAHCFSEAHELGREVSSKLGCPMKQKSPTTWNLRCGVLALHSRVGMSIGGATWGHCSICGAEDFECDHVPGQIYEGEVCIREVYRVELDEVALVQFPDDPRCYRVTTDKTLREIEEIIGQALPDGAVPTCEHCKTCSGKPAEADIDQSLWPPLPKPPMDDAPG